MSLISKPNTWLVLQYFNDAIKTVVMFIDIRNTQLCTERRRAQSVNQIGGTSDFPKKPQHTQALHGQ